MNEFQQLLNRLTNWQRNQYARAGYPGMDRQDVSKLVPFFQMKKET